MLSFAAVAYMALARLPEAARRVASPTLLALGRNSFYVFIVHVFLCLALASLPGLAGDGAGPVVNALAQLAVVALLVAMVRRRVLFGLIPR
jgi:peptidoglycan/LPS O-acetylase OafA/YrhL